MINNDLRTYDYYLYGANDAYGQAKLTEEKQGSIKMAIYLNNQSNNTSISYTDCDYFGLTKAPVSDAFVIQYEDKKLKVKYLNRKGRYTQVWLTDI